MIPRKLTILLFLGLILRLVLSVQIYSGDVNNHIAWGRDSIAFGFAGIYEREFFHRYGVLTPTYPPVAIFLFTAFYWFYQSVYQAAWNLNLSIPLFPSNLIFFLEDQDTLPAFLKIPAIMADIGIAVLVYLFARKLVPRANLAGYVGVSFVLFNPAFFYNSAYWGQIESIPLFFVLAAFYNLFHSKHRLLPWVLFTLALLTKQTSIIFAPIFILAYLNKYKTTQMLKGIVMSLIFFIALFIPFYQKGNLLVFPFTTYLEKIKTGSGSDFVTDHAFNAWYLITHNAKIPDSNIFLLDLPFKLWGYLIFAFFAVSVIYISKRKGFSDKNSLVAAGLISFTAFLFLTKMHERYLEQSLPFLLLSATKTKRNIFPFIIISCIHFLNLYHNWWAPRINALVDLLSNEKTLEILTSTLISIFFLLLIQYLKD